MKITFDTAGKGFLARLGDLILNKFDGSERHKSEAIAALTQAVLLVAGRLGALNEPEGDIEGFYAAWEAHRHAGFAVTQAEADKLAEMYGVKAPDVTFGNVKGREAWGATSWERLADVLVARDAFRADAGSLANMAADYIEKIDSQKDGAGIHKSWFALFEFLDARGVSGSGDHGADAIAYIKSLESNKKAAS